ncbi:MAG TPA: aminoglycoside phosphotransferase family protein [Actinomycetota bacterium]|nr:aminoglycoside phosphotransferase family protein [Actinomycetota bacterium]
MNQRTLGIDPGSRERLTERFGHAVEGWFAQLPGILVTLADRWHIELGAQIPRGSVSIVYRCRLADGRRAVLKVSPDRARIADETAALRAWHTVHVPRVFGSDEALGALLIEAVEPGTPLDSDPDHATGETVAELVSALHLGTPNPSFPPVASRIEALFRSSEALYRRDPGLTVVISKELYARGRALAERLAGFDHLGVLLHGDLTPSNILTGGEERGLVAIDPAPCVGDAAFDVVDLVLWQVENVETIERRAEHLAVVMDVDASLLFSWCVAFAGMNALELAATEGTPANQIETLVAIAGRA